MLQDISAKSQMMKNNIEARSKSLSNDDGRSARQALFEEMGDINGQQSKDDTDLPNQNFANNNYWQAPEMYDLDELLGEMEEPTPE